MIKQIYLRDFRNYKEAVVDFGAAINVLMGNNAQGKTNLLEAIGLLMTGRSFRTPHLAELIRFGASTFYLEALFEKNGVEQILKFSFNGKERKIMHNAASLPSLSILLGILQGVILSPEDGSLIKGSPQKRRDFLDLLLAQGSPHYLYHLSRYWRALKQRNVLLKSCSQAQISVWEEQMALAGATLVCQRAEIVERLGVLSDAEGLSCDKLDLIYRSSALSHAGADPAVLYTYFLEQFEKYRKREVELGVTLTGPHRDDLNILLKGKEARQFASEGEQRSCAVALKLAQWKWLYALAKAPPLLCIDDLGVSFDSIREEELYKRLQQVGQVFVTTARPTSLACRLIKVQDGNFVFEQGMDQCSDDH
jgi:DNA replication and repair protein RecF